VISGNNSHGLPGPEIEDGMDHRQVGRYWNGNAEAWTLLARAGYDIYRDYLNTPAFLEMLPDVDGLLGLDIGCGEGHNTRLLAQRGARMMALDISKVFVQHAQRREDQQPLGIGYHVASAVELPFAGGIFDFATGFMSFMDIPETGRVLSEAYRVLKPGGFLQFSISHPCFDTPHRRNLRDEEGFTYAIEVGEYFRNRQGDVVEWLYSTAPPEIKEGLPPFRTPRFTRTLSQWLNLIIEAGFLLERVEEPRPSDETVRECPDVQDAQVVAYFLHVRARKPPGGGVP
jgi:ubiquinone/menaquinone biosynthesis C-methylase UbiE